MSVLIKDMEMPTSCTMCWLNTFCGVWNTEPVKHKGFNERLESCPLTELIRCKDCIHFDGHYCHNKWWGDGYGNYTSPIKSKDGHCDWAERRGEECKTSTNTS